MTSSPSKSAPRLKMQVSEGIDMLLHLFEKAGQRCYLRKIMTAKSNGQITVHSKEQMLQKFEEADFIDCRVNAYPTQRSDRSIDKQRNIFFSSLSRSTMKVPTPPHRKTSRPSGPIAAPLHKAVNP